MPIDAAEKALIDAVDGSHRIRDIIERALPSPKGTAQRDLSRTFFVKLWQYDQVVFDASGTGGETNKKSSGELQDAKT